MRSNTTKLPNIPLVYVIVLNWDGKEHLQECFSSLKVLEYPNARTAMVDNGSQDGSVAFVQQHFPWVEIIALKKNIGFAAGNNAGIRHAMKHGAKYIALLNNDTAVHPRWISELVAVAEADPRVGVCATKMLYYDNRNIINGVGVVMNRLCSCWDKHNMRFTGSVKKSEEVLAACGGAFFLRAACLEETGLFDPSYFIYLEDVDLCIRIRQAGYRIITAPRAMIYHKFSATMVEGSPWKNYLLLRNRLRLLLKLHPANMVSYALPRMIGHELRAGLRWFRNTEFKRNLYQVRSFISIAVTLPRILLLRCMLRRTRKSFPRNLIHQSDFPPFFPGLYHPSPPGDEDITNRLFMGVSDQGLQDGWFSMRSDRGMRYRTMSKEASLVLCNPSAGDRYIQIQVAQADQEEPPNSLHILWNGREVGRIIPTPVWRTFHVKADLPGGKGEMVLRADHNTRKVSRGAAIGAHFKVAEISILEEGSPFLRGEFI